MSYDKLPPEIKLEIWKLVLPKERTMHHFRIAMPSLGGEEPIMTMYPGHATKQNYPAWRDFWKFRYVDSAACYVVRLEKRLIIWPAPFSKDEEKKDEEKKDEEKNDEDEKMDEVKKEDNEEKMDEEKNDEKKVEVKDEDEVKVEEKKVDKKKVDKKEKEKKKPVGLKASIDADLDVVHFRFSGTAFNPYLLALEKNRKVFAGIKSVAVDWKINGVNWDIPPFTCLCRQQQHLPFVCPFTTAKWLSYFEDVEVFYVILKITRKDIDEGGMYHEAKQRFRQGLRERRENPILRETVRDWAKDEATLLHKMFQVIVGPAPIAIREWTSYFRRRCSFFPSPTLRHETYELYIPHPNTNIFSFNSCRDCGAQRPRHHPRPRHFILRGRREEFQALAQEVAYLESLAGCEDCLAFWTSVWGITEVAAECRQHQVQALGLLSPSRLIQAGRRTGTLGATHSLHDGSLSDR